MIEKQSRFSDVKEKNVKLSRLIKEFEYVIDRTRAMDESSQKLIFESERVKKALGKA